MSLRLRCHSADIRMGVPQRASAAPLSILKLHSVDEKSRSVVTKLRVASLSVLTKREREEKVGDDLGVNIGTADCLRLRTAGLHNRNGCALPDRGGTSYRFLFSFSYLCYPTNLSLFLLLL